MKPRWARTRPNHEARRRNGAPGEIQRWLIPAVTVLTLVVALATLGFTVWSFQTAAGNAEPQLSVTAMTEVSYASLEDGKWKSDEAFHQFFYQELLLTNLGHTAVEVANIYPESPKSKYAGEAESLNDCSGLGSTVLQPGESMPVIISGAQVEASTYFVATDSGQFASDLQPPSASSENDLIIESHFDEGAKILEHCEAGATLPLKPKLGRLDFRSDGMP
jgi:hypothetical protein